MLALLFKTPAHTIHDAIHGHRFSVIRWNRRNAYRNIRKLYMQESKFLNSNISMQCIKRVKLFFSLMRKLVDHRIHSNHTV